MAKTELVVLYNFCEYIQTALVRLFAARRVSSQKTAQIAGAADSGIVLAGNFVKKC